jgi:hypothetical protein
MPKDADNSVNGLESVGELVKHLDLPNPTTPVPFEKFAHLKDSDDIWNKAAFWAFYAAWLHDQQTTHTNTVSVEARNDAHIFNVLSQNLHIRDCVLVRKDELTHLVEHANTRVGTALVFVLLLSTAAVGIMVGMVLMWNMGITNGQ